MNGSPLVRLRWLAIVVTALTITLVSSAELLALLGSGHVPTSKLAKFLGQPFFKIIFTILEEGNLGAKI